MTNLPLICVCGLCVQHTYVRVFTCHIVHLCGVQRVFRGLFLPFTFVLRQGSLLFLMFCSFQDSRLYLSFWAVLCILLSLNAGAVITIVGLVGTHTWILSIQIYIGRAVGQALFLLCCLFLWNP